MSQFGQLHGDPLTSCDGRHVLGYDSDHVATLVDTTTGEVTWRAGAPGTLTLGYTAVEVRDPSYELVWTSDLEHPDADALRVTDSGDLELLSTERVRLVNSRTGAVETAVLRGSAPVSAITGTAHLVRTGRRGRSVARGHCGLLRASEDTSGGLSGTYLPEALSRWFDQDGAELTWRKLPDRRGAYWRLCLVGRDGNPLWREVNHNTPAEAPPSTPYAHGGPELPAGGRLRHQSLTSPNGSHTLVHQDDGNLVLYCDRAVWATGTHWVGDGWVDLTDGDLVVRTFYGAPVWRAGTTGATRLVVADDGTVRLDGTSWVLDGHAGCAATGADVGRGDTLLPGQSLRRQSSTSADGTVVFAHRDDKRLVLHAADGTWQWDRYLGADDTSLVLDDDGVLRVRGVDGGVVLEIAGPADALVVTSEGVELLRDGVAFWRDGASVRARRRTGAGSGA